MSRFIPILKKLYSKKVIAYNIPKSSETNKNENFFNTVLLNILGESQSKLLLSGNPGTGKSQRVKDMMTLLKMKIFTIEAPHISEEDIINIPYLIKKGSKVTKGSFSIKDIGCDYEVVNAESSLITKLKNTEPLNDKEYNDFLSKNKIYANFADKYSDVIKEVSSKYQNVLFLDEFYRTGSIRIQNLFRTILNGNLGNTPIPENVYIIYASNMDNSDDSLDDIPLNHQFDKIDFDNVSTNDFFRYIADRFTNIDIDTFKNNNKTVNHILNPIVYNKFFKNITEENLGSKCEKTGIRISPRRWEEIFKYISINLPVKNTEEAILLITFLQNNFTDYRTKQVSSMYPKFRKILDEIILETSNINSSKLSSIPPYEWKEVLTSQIQTKIKLHHDRKYIPIISGQPGIGKTEIIQDISEKFNLEKIIINVSTLNSEDVIGFPLPKSDGKNITTTFSESSLYRQIMSLYNPKKKEETNLKYTHVLFLEEFSRTSMSVFNSIRTLVLDKKVGILPIPDDILIVATMNPEDIGSIELSDHMIDSVDIIQAEPKFIDVIKYVSNQTTLLDINKKIGFNLTEICTDIFTQCTEYFEESINIEDTNKRKFYWTDGFNVFFVSPRDINNIISGSILDSYNILKIKYKFSKNNLYNEKEIQSFLNIIEQVILDKYEKVLSFIAEDKHQINTNDFSKIIITISGIISSNMYRIKNGFMNVQSEALQSIKSIFENVNYNVEKLLNCENICSILEKTISDSDVNTFGNDIAEIFDFYNHKQDLMEALDYITGVWVLLSKIDWTKFDGELTYDLSTKFIYRGFIPLVQEAERRGGNDIAEYLSEPNNQKYKGAIDDILDRIEAGTNNIFVPITQTNK